MPRSSKILPASFLKLKTSPDTREDDRLIMPYPVSIVPSPAERDSLNARTSRSTWALANSGATKMISLPLRSQNASSITSRETGLITLYVLNLIMLIPQKPL